MPDPSPAKPISCVRPAQSSMPSVASSGMTQVTCAPEGSGSEREGHLVKSMTFGASRARAATRSIDALLLVRGQARRGMRVSACRQSPNLASSASGWKQPRERSSRAPAAAPRSGSPERLYGPEIEVREHQQMRLIARAAGASRPRWPRRDADRRAVH